MPSFALYSVAALLFTSASWALENGLARTPQMGWNTWNKYYCNITEDIIKYNVDAIQKLGLDKVGYKYINVDDCWMLKERD